MAKKSLKLNKDKGEVQPREITEEMKESYIDYAMSVIISRALPDVRDGLKPVHRRILYTMYEDGLRHNTRFRKSASVIGSVLAKYHPHGDMAVYDALARMAQDFSLRYPLIKGQGNFGCFTKDTKVKLTDGRKLNFIQLIREQKERKRHWTFAFNHETEKIEVAEIKKPRLTRKKEKVLEVTIDNGEKIKCTLDHRFMMRNGSYKQAKNLKTGDSLMPLYTKLSSGAGDRNLKGYKLIYQPVLNDWDFVHRLADNWNLSKRIYNKSTGRIRHHLDFDKLNNNPDNILRIRWKDHWRYHKDISSERHKDPVYIKKISEGRDAFWSNPNNRKAYSERMRSRNLLNWQNDKYRKKMSRFLSVMNKEYYQKHPELAQKLSKRATATLKRLWKIPKYRQLFHEKIVAGNQKRKTNLTGKKKFLRIYKYLIDNKLLLNKENFERTRKDVFQTKSFTSWDLGIQKYYNYNLDLLLSEVQTLNHEVVKIKILKEKEDVYDLSIDKLHNFALGAGIFVHNSIDGDNPAAYRYTEARLSKIGERLLEDIEKDTVDFVDNYDGTKKEPIVLPSPLPQLLLNGSLGIAVGMTTNIPPHNLSEVISASIYLIDNPKVDTKELFQYIQGPDFPTGGEIFNKKEIIQAYSQGKGSIVMRGKAEIVKSKEEKKRQIVITEIPYQIQKSSLVKDFAELVQKKKLKGIKDIRDESDREGLRIVIDLHRSGNARQILNRLYRFTNLQKKFYLNMLALEDGIQPKVLSLPDILNYFILHRKEVVLKRTKHDLEKAKERAHILEGLAKCLSRIDEVIETIKKSQDRQEAHKNLKKRFKLTSVQAEAILETKLSALARLERKKIEDELKKLKIRIKELSAILKSPQKIKEVIKKELKSLKEEFGDKRKTKVRDQKVGEFKLKDLVAQEQVIITLTQGGYIKRLKSSTYKVQKRGGKGILGMKTMGEDVIKHFLLANTHDYILFFTDSGKVFSSPAYEIPEAIRVAKGRSLSNFLEISSEEKVLALFPLQTTTSNNQLEEKFLAMATKNGIIKKTKLEDFKNLRRSGLKAISLKKGDVLRKVKETEGADEIILVTKKGQSIRFSEKEVRPMGRTASGVKGIRLKKGDEVVGMEIIKAKNKKEKNKIKEYLLVVMENGYGKRTDIKEYKAQKRGGMGVKAANITSKTGLITAIKVLEPEEKDLIVISKKAQVIRTKIVQISKLSRATQGVRIMRLEEGDRVASAIFI